MIMVKNKLQYIQISRFTTENGAVYNDIILSYQLFGKPLGTAPVVLVNHALTGNSEVCGPSGWWSSFIGKGQCVDTDNFTVLSFNIPGNGFEKGNALIENYTDFVARDIAKIFIQGLSELKIAELHAAIGGSLGGGIAWEMAALKPNLIKNLIPIAADWKASDWMIANCFLQDRILNNSSQPIEDARIHAMLCYRTPVSLKTKFQRTKHEEKGVFNTESWLSHHGEKLKARFQLSAYKLMNQLLKTVDITRGRGEFEEVAQTIQSTIHIVGIDTDLFFTIDEHWETYQELQKINAKVSYSEIRSKHGHDAFLIAYDQLKKSLQPIFQIQSKEVV